MLNYLSKNAIFRLFKYCTAGGIGACIDFGLFSLFINYSSLNYLYSNAISFSLGTLVVYYLQKNWTFQYQSGKNLVIFPKFASTVIVTYILNNLILILCIGFLQINPILAKAVQIILSFIWGYMINKRFVFKKKGNIQNSEF